MFVRQNFITNSSTCSFIAWGVPVDWDRVNTHLKITNRSDKEIDDFWDDMYNGKFPVALENCGYSGKMWAIVTDSWKRHLEDEDYIILDVNISEEWKYQLKNWCEEFGLPCENPCWFFATVGC